MEDSIKTEKSVIAELAAREDLDNPEIEEALESVPPEKRRVLERVIISAYQMQSVSSPENAVMKQITSEHITKYLEGSEIDMRSRHKEKRERKIFVFLSLLITMIFFLVIIQMLKDNPSVMENIIYAVGGVIAGAFGGYGVGRNKDND